MPKRFGFTLIELLIVVAILGILTFMVIFGLTNNLGKSRDGKRKADLDRIKIAMEDYYGDKNEYPPQTILENCESKDMSPYLPSIPCDPKTKLPYCYIYDADAPVGQSYKIFASLENTSDPVIQDLGCDNSPNFCGYETECEALVGYSKVDYGVSSSNVLPISEGVASGYVAPVSSPSSSPIGTLPVTTPGEYACDNNGNCTHFDNPTSAPWLCPVTWDTVGCNGYCDSAPPYALCKPGT